MLLLKIVKDKADVSVLLKKNVTYSEIASLLKEHIEEGNVHILSNDIVLTTKGLITLEREIGQSLPKEKDLWITPQYNKRKASRDIDKIVLPNKT